MNKYLEKAKSISSEFNTLPLEQRKLFQRHYSGMQLITIEQLKIILKRRYEGLLRELTDWENNILKTIESEE